MTNEAHSAKSVGTHLMGVAIPPQVPRDSIDHQNARLAKVAPDNPWKPRESGYPLAGKMVEFFGLHEIILGYHEDDGWWHGIAPRRCGLQDSSVTHWREYNPRNPPKV